MGIKFYQAKNGEIALEGPEHLQSLDNLWIDAQSPTIDEEKAIETRFGVEIINEIEARGLEDSSKFFAENSDIYMVLTIPSRLNAKNERELGHKRSFLHLILTAKTLISIHDSHFKALEVGKSRAKARINGAKSASDIMVSIFESIIERQADLLANIGQELDNVSLPAIAGRKVINAEIRIRKLGQLGAHLALTRDCLYDLNRALNFLLANHGDRIDGRKIRSFLVDLANLQRQCEAQSNDLTFVLDATLGLVGARQSRALNFMAVVTLLFAPATLISSVFGMNFGHWAFLDYKFGLPLTFTAMAISALLVLAIAKYAKLF